MSQPAAPPSDQSELSFKCFEFAPIDSCKDAKFDMLKNNKVSIYNDEGKLVWYNTCGSYPDDSQDCIILNSWYLVDSSIQMMLFLLNYGMEAATAGMTKNMILGVNALRCAALNGFVNFADLLAAAFLVAKQFFLAPLLQ